MTNYAGSQLRIRGGGSQVRVTLSSNEGQGNGGTSLPCAGCYVQAVDANTDVVRMAIGVQATDAIGIDLGRPHIKDATEEYGSGACQPMWVPTDDVSNLYFYSGQADAVVDILYFTD